MIFNSFQFLWLFPLVFVVYYFCCTLFNIKQAARFDNYLLLLISYLLYFQWNPIYTLILLGVTLCTYFSAIVIENKGAYGQKKYIITTGVLLTLFPLIIFKYYNFIIDSFNGLFAFCGAACTIPGLNYASDTLFLNKKEYFKDSTHLNHEGAVLFTSLLVPELKRLLRE